MNGEPRPKFAIVTATFNPGIQLLDLRDSLLAQSFSSFEWIVQDGGSPDRAIDVIEADPDVRIRLVRESDDGIYDAFNRALRRVRAEWVLFLGADDRLADERVLADLAEAVTASPEADVVLCTVRYADGHRVESRIGRGTAVLNTVHHQGVLYRRRLISRYRYPTDIPVIADYDLNLRVWRARVPLARTDRVVTECGEGGVSRTANEFRLYWDMHRIRARCLPSPVSGMLLVIGVLNVIRRRLQRAAFVGSWNAGVELGVPVPRTAAGRSREVTR